MGSVVGALGRMLEIESRGSTYPVLIVEDHCIRCYKVQTQTTCSCAQQEESWRVRVFSAILETIHSVTTVGHGGGPVNTTDRPFLELGRPVLQWMLVRDYHPRVGSNVPG